LRVLVLALLAGGIVILNAQRVLPGRRPALPDPVVAPPTYVPYVDHGDSNQPDLRLAVVGDIGDDAGGGTGTAAIVGKAGLGDPFDALIVLGDNVYPRGDPDSLDATLFRPYGPVLDTGASLIGVLGNHDVMDGNAAGQVDALGMPGRWYVVEFDDVNIIVLDTNQVGDETQLAWLEAALAAAGDRWLIVALHHAPVSAGFHGSDQRVLETFVPLFEQFGVDLVLAGHDHDYQRSRPLSGVTYVVAGGGSRLRPAGRLPFTAASVSVRHFVDLGVWDDRLEIRAVGEGGVFDNVTIPRKEPSTAAITGGALTAAHIPPPAEPIVVFGAVGLVCGSVILLTWSLLRHRLWRVPRLRGLARDSGVVIAGSGLVLVVIGSIT
jgi:predicted phosphodiesterase